MAEDAVRKKEEGDDGSEPMETDTKVTEKAENVTVDSA